MKTRTSGYLILLAVVVGLILAYVFLLPSNEPPPAGVYAPATASSGPSAQPVPVTPGANSPVTVIPPVPPSNFIPAPVPVSPPVKPQPMLDNAIRLPVASPLTNQTPPAGG